LALLERDEALRALYRARRGRGQDKLTLRGLLQSRNANYAEPVSKWIAAESDGRIARHAVHLLGLRASRQRPRQRRFEIFNPEINVNGRPVPLVPANVTASFRR
jgi:hypothetical protein